MEKCNRSESPFNPVQFWRLIQMWTSLLCRNCNFRGCRMRGVNRSLKKIHDRAYVSANLTAQGIIFLLDSKFQMAVATNSIEPLFFFWERENCSLSAKLLPVVKGIEFPASIERLLNILMQKNNQTENIQTMACISKKHANGVTNWRKNCTSSPMTTFPIRQSFGSILEHYYCIAKAQPTYRSKGAYIKNM